MNTHRVPQIAAMLLTVAALAGCASKPRPMYHWGEYQPQVYAHFQGDGQSPEQQLLKLEASVQKASADNLPLPPGFNAHLGLLYLKAGQPDRARAAFQTEQLKFPESKPFMDFLVKKLDSANGVATP